MTITANIYGTLDYMPSIWPSTLKGHLRLLPELMGMREHFSSDCELGLLPCQSLKAGATGTLPSSMLANLQ